MSYKGKIYPDNSPIFAQKDEGRRKRAALSFAEKLVALDELRARTESMARAREERKHPQQKPRQRKA